MISSFRCFHYCLDLLFNTDLYSFLTHYVAKASLNPDPRASLSQCWDDKYAPILPADLSTWEAETLRVL